MTTIQDASVYLRTEPRIWLIKRQLEQILKLVDLEKDGKVVEVDGFRLKNLSQWADHSSSLYSNIGSVSGYCNADCIFCYEKGNPLPFARDLIPFEEVKTRIKYYSYEKKKGLPTPARFPLEPFCHPHFLEILKLVRESDVNSVIWIATNGGFLTEKVIRDLSCLQPVMLCVSLNSADPLMRATVMREPKPCTVTAIASIPLLQKYRIVYDGSIVAWPSIPSDDLVNTIQFLDNHDARVIRVLLPGYSQYFSNEQLFDTDTVWQDVVRIVMDLREEIDTPITCQPSLYWVNPLLPLVDGVVKRSPAAESGLTVGDIILKVNDEPVYTRVHAAHLLSASYESGSCQILVSRKGEEIAVDLQETNTDEYYPYKMEGMPPFAPHFGIMFIDDFLLSSIQDLINIIENHGAHNVILLSSKIMKPIVLKAIEMVEDFQKYFSRKNLAIHVPPHHFWGGNILLGDLYTAKDYTDYLTALMKMEDTKPDLVVIPLSHTSRWGYDLTNESFATIEQEIGVPTEFLHCEPIFY
ncbi:MAG: PDZ domain-containing protein [Theionarchaea archaeon]|nr:PDZ domain-containing protein [Theionarchaea archaeon]